MLYSIVEDLDRLFGAEEHGGADRAADADTEFVMFSPADLLETTEAAIAKAMEGG